MEARTLAAVILAAFAVCACGKSERVEGASGDCNSGVCKLDVTVAAAGCADPANISVSPDPVKVPKNQPNKIEWTIATDGYSWVAAPGGITSLPSTQFENPPDNGKKYQIHDKNTDQVPTDYKYDVHLKDANGNLCGVKDPTIKNGAS